MQNQTRFAEQIITLNLNFGKSDVAKYCITNNHSVSETNLLKRKNNRKLLNVWETRQIFKQNQDNLMTIEQPPIINSFLIVL